MSSHRALLVLLSTLVLGAASLGAQPVPLNEAFRISPPFPGVDRGQSKSCYEPGVTALAGGGFATAWAWTTRWGHQSIEDGIDGRFLDPVGLGPSSFEITSTIDPWGEHMNCPVLAPRPGGGFILVESELRTYSRSLVIGLFAADGTGSLDDLRFVDDGVGDACPALASRPDGGFVIAWPEVHYDWPDKSRTVIQSFDSLGRSLGPEVYLDDLAEGDGWTLPAVGTDGQGRAVVVWRPSGGPLRAQRIDRDGTLLGPSIVVAKASVQHHAVAVAPDGSFAVAWIGPAPKPPFPLLLSRFAADGTPLGPPVAVARPSTNYFFPSTAVDRHGNIVLGWSGNLLLVNRSLVPQGPPVAVVSGNDWTRLALNGKDRILTVWSNGDIWGRFWQIRREADLCLARGGRFLCDTAGDGGTAEALAFGLPLDHPLLGDADGDGRADPCVWRKGLFLCDTAHDGGTAEVRIRFGRAGDVPLFGDLDGDGRADPCVWRGGRFLCDIAHNGGGAERNIAFGPADGVPLLADLDGDRRADPCVWKAGRLLGDTAHNGGQAELKLGFHPEGANTGVPLVGDVDGDHRADLCLLRDNALFCGHFAETGGPPQTVMRRIVDARTGDVPLLGDVDAF